MIPDKEQLGRWLRSAFEAGPEVCRDDFKRCLDALIDTLAELERVRGELELARNLYDELFSQTSLLREELAGCERACRERGEALERAGLL